MLFGYQLARDGLKLGFTQTTKPWRCIRFLLDEDLRDRGIETGVVVWPMKIVKLSKTAADGLPAMLKSTSD
jgi:hypothetical protein